MIFLSIETGDPETGRQVGLIEVLTESGYVVFTAERRGVPSTKMMFSPAQAKQIGEALVKAAKGALT